MKIDISIALREIYKLALSDGDLGYEYWHKIAQMLIEANKQNKK